MRRTEATKSINLPGVVAVCAMSRARDLAHRSGESRGKAWPTSPSSRKLLDCCRRASRLRLMSALGQKQTSEGVQAMSALHPKADIETQSRDVRFVPKADICTAAIHLSQLTRRQATEICDPVRGGMREFHQLLIAASPCLFDQVCASVTSA